MKITNKTVFRVITIIIISMLAISILTTGLTSPISLFLIVTLVLALFNDDLASYEYVERNNNHG